MRSDPAIWVANQFYTKLVGKLIPAKWFGFEIPQQHELSMPGNKPHLEIVSHCWQYAHMWSYQISSLLNFPPQSLSVTYTLYYADEDEKTQAMVDAFSDITVPNVTWNWNRLPKESIFRRAIGRNQAALNSTADWLWFSDCDLIFHRDCLDTLAGFLSTKQTGLLYPAYEGITDMLPSDHPMIDEDSERELPNDIDTSLFYRNDITKAKGAFQIVHGDVARAAGYCNKLSLYQQPDNRWRKTYEDTVFRNLIGYEGEPVEIPNLYRIRHVAKGRYTKDSNISELRSKIRHVQDGKIS